MYTKVEGDRRKLAKSALLTARRTPRRSDRRKFHLATGRVLLGKPSNLRVRKLFV